MKRFDVTALGELLIDFTDSGESERGNRLLEANPGGAPCNVLAMLQKLGKQTAFLGKVGQDAFGDQIAQQLFIVQFVPAVLQAPGLQTVSGAGERFPQLLSVPVEVIGFHIVEIDAHGAQKLEQIHEPPEVQFQIVVDVDAEILLDGPGKKINASVHVGGVQQSFLPVGEGHIQIPHEGDDAHLIGGGIDTEDHHAVRAHLFLVILPPVLADQQDILDLIVTDDIRLRVRADKLHVLFLLQGILGGQLLRHASLGSGRRCRFGGIEVFRKGFHLMGLRSHFLFGTAASGEEQAEHQHDPQQQRDSFLSH